MQIDAAEEDAFINDFAEFYGAIVTVWLVHCRKGNHKDDPKQ